MGYIKYYPLSRVKTGLQTTGNAYTLNGKPYKGPYYITFTGQAYSGVSPATGPNDELTPIAADRAIAKSNVIKRSSALALRKPTQQRQPTPPPAGTTGLKALVPAYPKPLEPDYQTGYFTRYFAKKVNMNSYLMEISYEDWVTMRNQDDYEDYESIDLFWQLTGPLHDERISQYQIKGGVYDTNKRIVEGKAKGFNGLIEYIGGDYTKYARITE